MGTGSAQAPVADERDELGVFILWADGRTQEDRILSALIDRFDVRSVIEVTWTEELVTENFARFYGNYPLPPYSTYLEAQKGRGPFLLITATDPAARHEERLTTSGPASVSVNFFEAKQQFRRWTGGGMRIHCTDSPAHAARDLMLLLGTDPNSHLRDNPGPWDGTIRRTHRDLAGAHGWRSIAHLFHVLGYTVPHVVLRNHETLLGPATAGASGDFDLLTSHYYELIRITRARPQLKRLPPWGGRFSIEIGGHKVPFNIRFVGDRYYDPSWARSILDRRVSQGRFFTLNDDDRFETLAYHAVMHSPALSVEYKDRLSRMAAAMGRGGWERSALDDPVQVKRLLDDTLDGRGYRYVKPRDVTVFYNFAVAGERWPEARERIARVRRQAMTLLFPVVLHPIDVRYRAVRGKLARYLPWVRKFVDVTRRAIREALHQKKEREYGATRPEIDGSAG